MRFLKTRYAKKGDEEVDGFAGVEPSSLLLGTNNSGRNPTHAKIPRAALSAEAVGGSGN